MPCGRRFAEFFALCLLALPLAGGCAPRDLANGVPYVTKKHHVADAKFQRVRDYPGLRVDVVTIEQLRRSNAPRGNDDTKAEATAFLESAHANALSSVSNELDRLGEPGWRELNNRYYADRSIPDDTRKAQIWSDFVSEVSAQQASLLATATGTSDPAGVRRELRRIERRIEPSIKTSGRAARAAPWALFTIPSLLVVKNLHDHEYRGPNHADLDSPVCYEPELSRLGLCEDTPDGVLLTRYAPIILQEQPVNVPYGERVDQFGRMVASSADRIDVDTSRPTVYAYSRKIRLDGRSHVQLIYTWWFPEHPKLKQPFDAENGRIEGITLRVTLDTLQRPIIFETVYNCGCYHRLYPTDRLESLARIDYGPPERGKSFSIECNVRWKIDMIVPKMVESTAVTDARPVVRGKAGWHGVVDVSMGAGTGPKEPRQPYTLAAYDELEHIPLPDGGYTSMFQPNGLVRGARRGEGIFFTPIGILSAGQPRQRGTQLIHWDHWDFDDPRLFEKTLRWPRSETWADFPWGLIGDAN